MTRVNEIPTEIPDRPKLDVDDLLRMEPDDLIPQLDWVQPDWWIRNADPDSVTEAMYHLGRRNTITGEYPSKIEIDRQVMVLKRRTLRTMMNVVWLCGHAGLHVTRKEAGE